MTSQPAYKQIQSYILRSIDLGIFKPETQIPTELELCAQFNVSRMTVNKAISELSQKGILNRIAGKGTFVATQKHELPVTKAFDIFDEISTSGNKYSGHQLQLKVIPASSEIALQLGVTEGSEIGYCKMLHFENDIPLMLEERYVNHAIAPEFTQQHYGDNETPSGYLQRHFPVSEMEHTIEAILASKAIANALSIKENAPCLQLSRRTWTENTLISYVNMISAGSRYKLKLHSRIDN
ncbi:HTH-type transcriptional repressor yvoA [Providencia rustigianii]|uniref:Histidine utilization repressor n=2 Tax=Providencia rustigianii TaxID=158850 RepID=D1P203_9GAMM|nr:MULTISPECIES: UTRA domain-containing protein [Providencia]EFB72624.1 putative histidine utilization repressor [Providencia rustigianii DSM 4541]MTC56506.1 UTRA domain-containing protein [Providencia rustigianii]SPY78843.1 HTH-type transcriptional repressor yvoA [Providencia rustigianii]SUC28527.1 HTH-type transcriptional repressor yvoA [Providencia rustigianii]SUC36829.1 HTH-type transcriptional repressor yvoA [Providencia rustigianii]